MYRFSGGMIHGQALKLNDFDPMLDLGRRQASTSAILGGAWTKSNATPPRRLDFYLEIKYRMSKW